MRRSDRPSTSGDAHPFRLVLERQRDNALRATLLQRESKPSGNDDEAHFQPIVSIWGLPLEVARHAIIQALRDNGINPARLSRPGGDMEEGIALDEASGVRLGLTLLSLKPLKKLERMERVLQGIDEMSREETLYWFAKCMNGARRRAGKALRVLLAEE